MRIRSIIEMDNGMKYCLPVVSIIPAYTDLDGGNE